MVSWCGRHGWAERELTRVYRDASVSCPVRWHVHQANSAQPLNGRGFRCMLRTMYFGGTRRSEPQSHPGAQRPETEVYVAGLEKVARSQLRGSRRKKKEESTHRLSDKSSLAYN